MYLVIVRHGLAGTREAFAESGKPDALRPLTSEGARKVRRVARGLQTMVPHIDVLATSPLTRARQTADIVAERFELGPIETDALVPDAAFTNFETWAKAVQADVLAIVGHEPHLSGLVGWLVSADGSASAMLKKGGACMIAFDARPRRGAGTLLWLMTPGPLRRL